MDLYFNPYPGATTDENEGFCALISAANTFADLLKDLRGHVFNGVFSNDGADKPISEFILIREESSGALLDVKYFLQRLSPLEREKVQLLLHQFSKGRVLDSAELAEIERWVVSGIGASAPVLEIAAKNRAIALTFATESEWRIDKILFDDRTDFLHNLWGQKDISGLKKHCIDSILNMPDKFSLEFGVQYCGDALNSAPTDWNDLFRKMQEARIRNYEIDGKILKKVGNTNYGFLLELRCYETGVRMFFVLTKDDGTQILVGGFYRKNQGLSQNDSINHAIAQINR